MWIAVFFVCMLLVTTANALMLKPHHLKPAFCICEQQSCCSACASVQSDQHLHCVSSRLSNTSIFYMYKSLSLAVQACLCVSWSKARKTGFLVIWLRLSLPFIEHIITIIINTIIISILKPCFPLLRVGHF